MQLFSAAVALRRTTHQSRRVNKALWWLVCIALAAVARAAETNHPPIPIRFHLEAPGYVTLVIEDVNGKRVRNLVSETSFPAGENVAWWDGLDDLGRDTKAAEHALYHVPGKFVSPARYTVRGLVRPEIDLRYQFTAYNPGDPPWHTGDRASEWIANHSPPSAVLFVPENRAPVREGKNAPGGQIIVGSFVSEGSSGVAWLDLNGHKLHGQLWIGGVWTGATHLTRDDGESAVNDVYAYTGSAWDNELRIYELLDPRRKVKAPNDQRFGTGEDRSVLDPKWKFPSGKFNDHKPELGLSGLAIHNGLLVASLPTLNRLLFIDAKARKELGTAPLPNPRGLAFDRQGRLLALSGNELLRFNVSAEFAGRVRAQPRSSTTNAVAELAESLPMPAILVKQLDDPQQLALDTNGTIFVSEQGASHHVRVFAADGKLLRTIGISGKPRVGPYEPRKMNFPNGLTITRDGQLWIAETDKTPKRVSVWSSGGKFVRALYGPSQYGGGGFLDSENTSRFFYGDEGGVELKLDWKQGTSEPVAVYYRHELDPLGLVTHYSPGTPPLMPIHRDGRTYLTDAHNNNPTGGWPVAGLWILEGGVARPVAAVGRPQDWKVFFQNANSNAFLARLPRGVKNIKTERLMFVWSDANDDGQPQPEEVAVTTDSVMSVNVMADLSFVTGSGLHLKPQRITKRGVPILDASVVTKLVAQTQNPASSGGGQALVAADGWAVFTTAPKPFSPFGLGGVRNGEPMWTYPSMWPGLHASHHAAMPEFPGELIGTTRLLGGTIRFGDLELFAVNGNKGTVYLFTTDGLFVATLFNDSRSRKWDFPNAIRDMLVNNASLHEETFWPTITQTKDKEVYLQALWSCIVKVEGLNKIRRLPTQTIDVTAAQLTTARDWFVQVEAARQETNGATMTVALRKQSPVVDGKADDWPTNSFVTIDTLRIQVGDWGSRRVKTQAALAVADGKLFVCLKTGEPRLLENSGDSFPLHFKTGGGIDLMLGTDASANSTRAAAAAGDVRLLVTRVKNNTVALLYRPVAPGGKGESFPFSSPLRTIRFDRIDDVSGDVTFATTIDRNEKERTETAIYEFSIPLATLGLKPQPGETILGDIGVLRGNGTQTMQRSYWRNKATGITADVPSEAELIPKLWGQLRFE